MTNVEELDAQHQLTIQAYNEVIEFMLEASCSDGYMDRHYFLEAWQQGNWLEIQADWPEFDLNSEAQQWLINETGGMPKE